MTDVAAVAADLLAADAAVEAGMKFLFHTDGRYGNFLPLIFDELGAEGLNPIERNGCNDIFEIRRRYPNKLLFGNVCCIHTLPHGSLGDVEDETLELIEKIGPQGGKLPLDPPQLRRELPLRRHVRRPGADRRALRPVRRRQPPHQQRQREQREQPRVDERKRIHGVAASGARVRGSLAPSRPAAAPDTA